IGVGEPEAAGEKSTFDRLLFVGNFARIMPQHKTVAHHIGLDGGDRAANPRVGWRQKPYRRQQQDAGVEQLRAIRIEERIKPGVKALFADVAMDRVAQFPPLLDGRLETEPLHALDPAVEW